jgi:hypothetical protein
LAAALNLALLFIIAWIFSGYLRYALISPPSFDGAMNLNTALSFMNGQGYGFSYDIFYPFPAQTDGPLVLPASILMRLGGVTPLTAQGVNLTYLLGTVLAAFLLFRSLNGSTTVALAGSLVVLMTPGLFPYSMGGYGEIPMLFWMLCSLNILAPTLDAGRPSAARLSLGGGALALCYLTKTVGAMLVIPTLIVFSSAFFIRHGRKSGRLMWLFIGLALPVLSWEVFRLIEIGSWRGYQDWWRLQFGQTLLQSGAVETLNGDRGPIATGLEHLEILAPQVGTPPIWLAIFLLVPWLAVAAVIARLWRGGDLKNAFCLAACWSIALLYFVWWLFIEATDHTWLRRIVAGLMLQQLIAVIASIALARAFGRSRAYIRALRPVLAGAAVLLLVSVTFLLQNGETFFHPPTASADDLDQIRLAKTIRELPADATLFGFGWWKAPVLALFSGRPITNLYAWDPEKINGLPHKYLVVDFYAKGLAERELDEVLSTLDSRVVSTVPGGAIYEIDKVLPYEPFSPQESDPDNLRAQYVAADGAYAASRGFYGPEGSVAWIKPDAALWLRRQNQTGILLSIFVPSQLTTEAPDIPLQIHLQSAGCLDRTTPLVPGEQRIVLPLACPPLEDPAPMELTLHVNGAMPRPQQIDGDQRRLAILVKDISLTGP